MRSLLMVCVVVGVLVLPTAANAAGEVSRAALAQVGLVGMQPMTDIEGVSVRGNGFALVSGSSFAFSVTGKPYAKFQTSAAPIGGKTVAIGYAGGLFSIANGGAVAYAK